MPKPPTTDPQTVPDVSSEDKGKLPDPVPKNASQVLQLIHRQAKRLSKLLTWMKPVPEDWIQVAVKTADGLEKLQSVPCSSYSHLQETWRTAMKWRQDLDDALSVVLAIALSTRQQGDQLFCMMIGDAGSGKTRICDALLVSKYCYPLEHVSGFFSGYKGDGDGDYSLINRVNNMLMVTPEGDVLMSNPKFGEIMSQQRRIFDGTSGASFKNQKEDKRYTGLRTPWLIAGTPALLDSDQTRLGDRFLKVFIDSPTEDQRRDILSTISRSAYEAVRCEASGENHVGPKLKVAYETTGGYVDWLRENNSLLGDIEVLDKYFDMCENWADFISYLRARPAKSEDSAPTREQPTRLTNQLVRLMCCLTVVLNRTVVDDEIMRRVRRVVLNTGSGIGYEICRLLLKSNNDYMTTKVFQTRLEYNKNTVERQLRLMKQIGALQLSSEDPNFNMKTANVYWRMSARLLELHKMVHEFKA